MAQLQDVSRKSVHFWIYYTVLCLFVISLSTSRFFLTLSLILLTANWIVETNFKEKLGLLKENKVAIAFILIFGLSLLGVLWAKDWLFAVNSLQHKLPVLILPLVIFTSPKLNVKQIRGLIALFVVSVFVVSLIGLGIRLFNNQIDYREGSPFVPATNYSYMLVLAAFQLPLLVRQVSTKRIHLALAVVISTWMLFFLVYLRSMSGLTALGAVLAYALVLTIYYHKSTILKVSFILVSFAALSFGVWLFTYMYNLTYKEIKVDLASLPLKTENGADYEHFPTEIRRENGSLVYLFIANEELETAWNSKSEFDFNGRSRNNEYLKHTLYRYMASKGLTKDKAGFELLTSEDIEAVEQGYTNYLYPQWPGIYCRVHELMMGLYIYTHSHNINPTWNSLSIRLELLKASLQAYSIHPWLGWGTGHIEFAVENGLQMNSSVLVNYNYRSHNQYLSILLLWGALGFIAFFALVTFIIIKSQAYKIFIFNIFLIAFAVNGIMNDPLEGQMGLSMFVFFTIFYGIFYPKLKGKNTFLY